jgi:transposase InsO family protein
MARICRQRQYSFEEKKLMLEEFLVSSRYRDTKPKEFSRICGVNYSTFRAWGEAIDWDVRRIGELRRKKRKPAIEMSQSVLSEVEQAKILEIKQGHKSWGPLKIKQYLWRHEQILLPQSRIYVFLKAQGLVRERKGGDEGCVGDRSFEYACPLAGVQMDLMHLMLASGLTIHLVTLLDDFSRYVLVSRFIAVKTMDEVIDVFKEGVRSYGVMDSLLTDQGSEFVSWQRFTRFEELLADLDVEYIASGPDKKENQGKLERWHQTVREELRLRGPLDYSSEAQMWIREVKDIYNFERPHQGIGGLVPADRFFGMREEIEAELERCRGKQGRSQQIYFVCRVGERKLVVSGPRPEKVTVLLDGRSIDGIKAGAEEEIQLEKRSVCRRLKPDLEKEPKDARNIEAD